MSENNINTKIKINKKLILNTSPVNKYNNMTENLNFEKETFARATCAQATCVSQHVQQLHLQKLKVHK